MAKSSLLSAIMKSTNCVLTGRTFPSVENIPPLHNILLLFSEGMIIYAQTSKFIVTKSEYTYSLFYTQRVCTFDMLLWSATRVCQIKTKWTRVIFLSNVVNDSYNSTLTARRAPRAPNIPTNFGKDAISWWNSLVIYRLSRLFRCLAPNHNSEDFWF